MTMNPVYVSSLEDYVQLLEKEVNIDFCWSMNRIIFDKTVTEDRDTFAFVTLPERDTERAPEKGRLKPISQLRFDYDTTTIRRYRDAFDYDESDQNYDMRSIRLRYDYDTTTT